MISTSNQIPIPEQRFPRYSIDFVYTAAVTLTVLVEYSLSGKFRHFDGGYHFLHVANIDSSEIERSVDAQ